MRQGLVPTLVSLFVIIGVAFISAPFLSVGQMLGGGRTDIQYSVRDRMQRRLGVVAVDLSSRGSRGGPRRAARNGSSICVSVYVLEQGSVVCRITAGSGREGKCEGGAIAEGPPVASELAGQASY